MGNQDELSKCIQERDAALKTLDVEYARKNMPNASDEVILIALHKARYEIVTMPDDLRTASGEWLKERGYKRMFGQEFMDDGLPA